MKCKKEWFIHLYNPGVDVEEGEFIVIVVAIVKRFSIIRFVLNFLLLPVMF